MTNQFVPKNSSYKLPKSVRWILSRIFNNPILYSVSKNQTDEKKGKKRK